MSALSPVEGEVFKATVFKSLIANPAIVWRNTYELVMGGSPSTVTLTSALGILGSFEQNIHLNTTRILYAIGSTWNEDSNPYNGDEFTRLDINEDGIITPTGEPEPLQVCLRVAFGVTTGRVGFRLYRGALGEGDVVSSAGTPALSNLAGINTRISNAITASSLNDLIGTSIGDMGLILKSDTGQRLVGSIGAQGVSVKKLNNKYFNAPRP